jgi:hypothetical protein
MKEILPINSFVEYRAICKVANDMDERKRLFGYFSNDKETNQRQENELQELKERRGKYEYDNNWKVKKTK